MRRQQKFEPGHADVDADADAPHSQKLLIAEHLTLSALYTVPIPEVCALPRGLDTHFVALLQSLTREQLWTRLRQEYRTMDEHVQEMENYTTQFAKLLEPIYKYVSPWI